MVKKSKRIYIKSFGCSANLADGEVIAGCLSKAGFNIVNDAKTAEFLIYNTCAVKSPTENRIINLLKKAPKNKKLIVTGCLPLINFERLKREVEYDGITGPSPGGSIVDVLNRVMENEHVILLKNTSKSDLSLPRIPLNPVISIIPISKGCLGDCSYCCVHFARGKLRSNSINEILSRIKKDLNLGFKEFWLTSQDTACYGKDLGNNLVDLIDQVCEIEGDFFVRIGMMNPDNVLNMLTELVTVYNCNKIFKFLHLPIQSGDNTVLRQMNRNYTIDEFSHIIKNFRKNFPMLTLSTDIICGFPGETEEAFENTKNLITEVKPDIVNVSKFFSRPHTNARTLSPINPIELNKRSSELSKLSRFIAFEKNKIWVDWEGTILVDEKGKEGSWMGRNFAYKPVVIKTSKFLLSKLVNVRVVNFFPTYVEAKIL